MKRQNMMMVLLIVLMVIFIPTVKGSPFFYEKILLDNQGKDVINLKPIPNFAVNAVANEGMFATLDDYGTSYYFRGAVDNNWVYFANYYWRVVRINGDNSVKLIFSGRNVPTENDKVFINELTDEEIDSELVSGALSCVNTACDLNLSQETLEEIYSMRMPPGMDPDEYDCASSNVHVCVAEPSIECLVNMCNATTGETKDYFWGSTPTDPEKAACFVENHNYCNIRKYDSVPFKTQIGLSAVSLQDSSLYYMGYMYDEDKLDGFLHDSDIKMVIDEWYEENLVEYQHFLADSIFCNDRKLEYLEAQHYTGDFPAGYIRLIEERNPRITCPNKNDAFTVSDTEKGNGALTYPIGLLSADEAAIAGKAEYLNDEFYLYNDQEYWLGTPRQARMSSYAAIEWFTVQFYTSQSDYFVDNTYGVRPVISLKANTLAEGTGEYDNPYLLSIKDEDDNIEEEDITVPPPKSKDNPQTGLFLNISLLMLILIMSFFVYKEVKKYNKFNKF